MPLPPPNEARGTAGWVLLLSLLFLLAQGPALAVGNVNWDGWIHLLLHTRGQDGRIVEEFFANGRPVNGWMMTTAFNLLGASRGTLWVSLACLYAATLLAWFSGVRSGLLGAREAALAALFVGINPADQMMLSSSSLHFFTAYAAFFGALYCSVMSERTRGAGRVAVEALAVLLACFAAATGDSIAFLLPALAGVRYAMAQQAGEPGGLKRLTLPRLLATGIGGLAFVAHFFLFPPDANFAPERAVGIGLVTSIELLARFAIAVAACYAPVWLAMLALGNRGVGAALVRPREWSGLAWFALALIALALLPYWLADRKPTITGWSVRFLFTLGPALALACIAWTRLPRGPLLPAARVLAVLMAALLLSYLARWPFWLERVVKDEAVVAYARTAAWPAQAQVICIYDHNPTVARPYRSLEWTGMAQWGSGRSDVIALQPASFGQLEQEIDEAARLIGERFPALTGTVPRNCTQEMLIPEPRADWPVTVALALARRTWMEPADYGRWLLARYPVSGRAAR